VAVDYLADPAALGWLPAWAAAPLAAALPTFVLTKVHTKACGCRASRRCGGGYLGET